MMQLKSLKIILLTLLTASVALTSYGQNAHAKLSIDSTQLMIGEQTLLHIELSYDKGNEVALPTFADTLQSLIEVIEVHKQDTSMLSDSRMQIKQDILITSYDEGLYHINPLPLTINGDTIYTNGVGLKVLTFPVDTADMRIFDIKTVITPEFVWADYHPYLVLILTVLFLLVATLYAYQQWKNKKPLFSSFIKEKPKLPPHIVALDALERIKKEKIWVDGKEKEYFTQITDVLRVYIEDRFGVNALEMTTAEILIEMKRVDDATEVLENLKQVLELADFVKFAKWKPLDYENETSLMNSLFFVQRTQPVEVAPVQEENTESEEAAK